MQRSLSEVNQILGLSATAPITFNDASVRSLCGKLSGGISMLDLCRCCRMTAAVNGPNTGFNTNVGSSFGALIPSPTITWLDGIDRNITSLYYTSGYIYFSILDPGGNVTNSDSIFTTLYWMGQTLARPAATYSITGNSKQWIWAITGSYVAGTYPRIA